MKISETWQVLKKTVSEFLEDKAPQLGASLAFYAAISIAPLLILALVIAAQFLGQRAAEGQIVGELESYVGQVAAQAIQDMIKSADKPGTGSLAAVLGIATLLFGASGVFAMLQTALNTIWGVKPKEGRGVWGVVRDRTLSFAMVISVAFLLLASVVLSTIVSSLSTWVEDLPMATQWVAPVANFLLSFAILTVLFAMIFKWLPDVRIAWSDVWLGAAVTAVLFTIGKFGISFYLSKSSTASSYGMAGSFVVLLLWIYYSAQIVFFGAEFTQVYTNRFGERIEPADNAERLTGSDHKQQGRSSK